MGVLSVYLVRLLKKVIEFPALSTKLEVFKTFNEEGYMISKELICKDADKVTGKEMKEDLKNMIISLVQQK